MVRPTRLALLSLALCACTTPTEEPAAPELPPPSIVQQTGKAMVTTQGYIHPTDPPGTWRARRPHGKLIEPCSDWIPNGPAITDAHGKSPNEPTMIYMSWTARERSGFASVTRSVLTEAFGAPHPATRSVMIGQSAPLGPHWTWTLRERPGPTFIAEAQPDNSIRFHFAKIGRLGGGGGNSASFMAECLVERYGTPGW